jgi:small multidrug resistance pump
LTWGGEQTTIIFSERMVSIMEDGHMGTLLRADVLFLALAVAFNVSHNVMLKFSAAEGLEPLKRYALIGFALMLGLFNAYFFSRALERLPLSSAYPSFSGTSVVLTMALGVFFFLEGMSLNKIIGAACVIVGIWLLNR